jgi:hypothetical protein
MKIGSQEHHDTFCRHFKRTYTDYRSEYSARPDLDAAGLHRLGSVPFWGEVFYTERRESAGVPAAVHATADLRLRIPLQAGALSLNVALAAAMVLSEVLRQTKGFGLLA